MHKISFAIIILVLAIQPSIAAPQEDENSRFLEIEGLINDQLYERALERIESFLKDYPNSPNSELMLFRLGTVQLRTNRFSNAVSTFEQFLERYPASTQINDVRFLLASSYKLVDNFTRAKQELNTLLRERRLDENLRYAALERRVDIHLQLGEQESARKDLEELVKRASTPTRKFRLANLLYEMGDLRGAERHFRQLVEDDVLDATDTKTAVLRLSVVLYQRNRFQDVVNLLLPLKEKYNSDDSIISALAWSLYRLQRYEEAYTVFNSRPVDADKVLSASIRSGRELLMVNEIDGAISYFQTLINSNDATPEIAPAYRGLADAYMALGDLVGAAETLEKMDGLIESDEDRFDLWIEIGNLYLDELGNGSKSAFAFRRALALDLNNDKSDYVSFRLIHALIATSDVAGARDAIVNFLNDFVDSAHMEEILFLAGQIYERSGDVDRALEHYRKIAQLRGTSPFRADAYQSALTLVQRLRRWDDVIAIGTEFLQEFPQTEAKAATHILLAKAYYQISNFEKGIEELEHAVQTEDTTLRLSPVILQIAWGYYKLGEFQQANVYYSRVVEEHPDTPEMEEALYWLGWLSQVNNSIEEANGYFQSLVDKYPSSKYAEISLYQLAKNYQQNDQTEEAISALKRIVESFPDGNYVSLAREMLINNYTKIGNFRSALETIDFFVESDPSHKISPTDLMARGNSLAEAGNLESALETFKRLQEMFPSSEIADEALFNIGNVYYKQGLYSKAVREFDKLAQFFPDSDKLTAASYLSGQSLMKLRKYEDAIEHFKRVLGSVDTGTGVGMINYFMGVCYEQTGKGLEAVAAYRVYLQNLDNPADMLERRLEIALLFMSHRFYDEAISQLQSIKQAATKDEMAMNAQYLIGQVLENKGDLTLAAEEYLKVTYAHASAPAGALMARMRAGRIYEQLGQYQEAINIYQTIADNHKNSRFGELAAIRIAAINKQLSEQSDAPGEVPDAGNNK